MLFKYVTAAALVGVVIAQRPSNISACDYYTTALFPNNTAVTQYSLLVLLVNTAVIGNYNPNSNVSVPGILTPGTYNGIKVNLLPYFSGDLASTNGGGQGISVNFLDGGGAAPLLLSKPANSTNTNQYFLLVHLYEYFGTLLGCSQQGSAVFPAYSGAVSQYSVHKFMDLSDAEVEYFILQVVLSAQSFGVTAADLTLIGSTLHATFGYRCSPPATVIPAQGLQLQSICTDNTCPISPNSTCSLYDQTVMKPARANTTSSGSGSGSGSGSNATSSSGSGSGSSSNKTSGSGSGSTTTTGSTSAPVATTKVTAAGSAVTVSLSFAAVAAGLAVYFL